MIRGLYTSISAMMTLEAKQSIVTNNLANVNTVGYKEDTLVEKSFDEIMLSNNDNYINGIAHKQKLGGLSFGTRIDENVTNHKQGAHISTENNTDFAIDGDGFFKVLDHNNKTFYTRNGSFNIDNQGYLVTKSGDYVLGTNKNTNNSEPIYVGHGKLVINPDNSISIDGNKMYDFNIVKFDNKHDLTKSGNNLYNGKNEIKTNNIKIKQGYLEGSNVDSIGTMSSLMETVKLFEANQKVIQTIDSTLSKVANEIGTVR